jgi:hypothetical protein
MFYYEKKYGINNNKFNIGQEMNIYTTTTTANTT